MNLIICTTPLQTLLAKEIVKNYEDEKFYGILFSNHFSKKVDRYFNLFGGRNSLKNKMLIKILLVNIVIVFLIGISFLFWSFLVPSFSLQYKKVSGDNKKNIEKIIDIFKWIIISLSIIDIPIAILNISISAYYFKNSEKIIKE